MAHYADSEIRKSIKKGVGSDGELSLGEISREQIEEEKRLAGGNYFCGSNSFYRDAFVPIEEIADPRSIHLMGSKNF
jgi:hypothetical protein